MSRADTVVCHHDGCDTIVTRRRSFTTVATARGWRRFASHGVPWTCPEHVPQYRPRCTRCDRPMWLWTEPGEAPPGLVGCRRSRPSGCCDECARVFTVPPKIKTTPAGVWFDLSDREVGLLLGEATAKSVGGDW